MPDPAPLTPEVLAAIEQAVARGIGHAVTPEALDAKHAAALCGVGVSTFYDLSDRGLCPEPVTLGDRRCRRWLRHELLQWLLAGCPSRAKWNVMRNRKAG